MRKSKISTQLLKKHPSHVLTHIYRYFMANRKSILLFIMVGTIAAMVYMGSFCILWKFAGINYKVAVSVAYLLSVIVHFSANRCIAFEGKSTHFVRQLPRYLTMIFINYVITLMITHFVVEVLLLTPYLGILFSIGVTINTSYFMLRYWVFPKAVHIGG